MPLTIVSPDLRDMRAFLCSPLPRNNGTLQCYIRRNKSGTHKLFPIYSLYLKVTCCASCMSGLFFVYWIGNFRTNQSAS